MGGAVPPAGRLEGVGQTDAEFAFRMWDEVRGPMKTYRLKLVLDFDAVDDVEARGRVRRLLADLRERVLSDPDCVMRPARANCVQDGDRSGRNVMRPEDEI